MRRSYWSDPVNAVNRLARFYACAVLIGRRSFVSGGGTFEGSVVERGVEGRVRLEKNHKEFNEETPMQK